MPIAIITGTVTSGGKPCPEATITSTKVAVTSLGGAFMCHVTRPGTYAFTVHAPGHKPTTAKVTLARLTDKAKEVAIKLKPAKAARG